MYYFQKKDDFNLNKYDVDVTVHTRLTKTERYVLSILIQESTRIDGATPIALNKRSYRLPEKELKKILISLNSKVINISVSNDKDKISDIFIKIFEVLAFENQNFIYRLSKEILLSNRFGNLFNRILLIPLMLVKNIYSYNFFKLLIKNIVPNNNTLIEYSIKEFKMLLGISPDTYTRFYDFEKKVLNSIKKDLEQFDMKASFDKIKSMKGKGSKIIGIKACIVNPFHIEVSKDTNKLLNEFSKKVEDFAAAYKNIYNYRKTHTFEETKEYVIKHPAVLKNS